ncbi:carbonic anhydrase family protein [Terrarubrum flagellatum]|uniref:carbonic anhydrase family protein n=1 Tax=Terrirubrum flagellatum TaxID=2895980 RepID=UPI0031454D82
MFTRRLFCGCVAASAGFSAVPASAQGLECAVFTPERQKALTPDDALATLKEGNARFLAGKSINCDLMAQVKATSSGQAPFAAVVGCIDSRVPPELVFDQRIGGMFVARVAGNFVNTDIIGSLEYSAKVVGARVIVVLGHSECGAIKGVVDDVKLGNLTAMLENLKPAVQASKGVEGEQNSHNKKLVQKVADANVRLSTAKLLDRSPVLKEMVNAGQLKIAGAMHDVATGRVEFFS